MAITTAYVSGGEVRVYDDAGHCRTHYLRSGDELIGYTSGSVSIQRGNEVFTYDEKGRFLHQRPIKGNRFGRASAASAKKVVPPKEKERPAKRVGVHEDLPPANVYEATTRKVVRNVIQNLSGAIAKHEVLDQSLVQDSIKDAIDEALPQPRVDSEPISKRSRTQDVGYTWARWPWWVWWAIAIPIGLLVGWARHHLW